MELSIDTSTNITGVALSREGEVIYELNWRTNFNHTVELAERTRELLRLSGAEIRDIKAVIVAKGPGSFSGLRVGMGFAKGISLSLNIPIVGIGTLDVQAFPFFELPFKTYSLLDIGRGEVALSVFEKGVKIVKEHITRIEELEIDDITLFCGEADLDKVRERFGDKAIIPRLKRPRRTGDLAALGWERLRRGERDDISSLEPLYLRKPSITKR